ncbi:hypothetical protein DXG03_003852 [Asterophora parasitica]|uniref:Dipeptidylpeptidase IV N-terminal domain-containing protein n=1 Tax=Asterophora parasitica TaxID=117018 RepID=A0A9P7G362_9AGAR|nr:hypothetical protein DXG03_003852 [Asterophora parasitica]
MSSSPYERLPNDGGGQNPPVTRTDSQLERPLTYYGEGTFDPPSSEDEDDDNEKGSLLDKRAGPSTPGLAELGDGFASGSGPRGDSSDLNQKRSSSLRFFAIVLAVLLLFSAGVGILAARSYQGVAPSGPGVKKLTMDHIFNGTFNGDRKSVNWVPEAGDGVFSVFDSADLKLVDLKTNTTRVLVSANDIKDEYGQPLAFFAWDLSPDMKYILLKTGYRKQWRWSTFGNYYVHNIDEKSTHPIIPPTDPSRTAYATWAPTGQSIAYVTDNDLYVLTTPTASPIRVTTSGNASLFHGVPDWVYEEEIFSSDFALWWSPDAKKVAFLVFDETAVDEYNFPIYNPTEDNSAVIPYTSDVVMKYPKPGYNNPLVSVRVFDLGRHTTDAGTNAQFPATENTLELEWQGRFPVENSVILEVAWVGDAALIVKEVNRNADDGHVVLFDLEAAPDAHVRERGTVVRRLGREGEEGDKGWIDNDQNIHRLPANLTAGAADAYLDIVATPEGYNHIALFSPASSGTPHFLTNGKWEVTNGIKGIDLEKGIVYGGPHSQLVDLKFARTWHDYVACGLQYIVVTVDGRGTGFKGRALRNPVKDNLGFYETIDQINAAK